MRNKAKFCFEDEKVPGRNFSRTRLEKKKRERRFLRTEDNFNVEFRK